MILSHHASGRTSRSLIGAAIVGLLALSACGDKGTTSNDRPAVTAAPDTSAPDTSVATTAGSSGTPTTPAGAADAAVDAELEQTIAEVEALLNETDKDLKAAQDAAANGG